MLRFREELRKGGRIRCCSLGIKMMTVEERGEERWQARSLAIPCRVIAELLIDGLLWLECSCWFSEQ